MSDMRLRNLAILSIERGTMEKINFEDIVRDFATAKVRKVNV